MSDTRFATGCEVAGIALVDSAGRGYRVQIIGGDEFALELGGSSVEAAESAPFTTLIEVGASAIHFGFNVAQFQAARLFDLKAAVNAALSAGATFLVRATDDSVVINHQCVPDFAAGFVRHEGQSGGWLRNVQLRFIVQQ